MVRNLNYLTKSTIDGDIQGIQNYVFWLIKK